MQTDTKYKAAIYLRLSREDGDSAESESIQNQRYMLTEFVSAKPDMQLVNEYVDDGYSGTSFNRPGFQQMLSDIMDGLINCVVVKDLSRFGRNYIEMGRYMETIFPRLQVRLIAVNDPYDSINRQSDADQILVPFKNLINDAYCRDISMKIRSQLSIMKKRGDYLCALPPYGYRKRLDDKKKLEVDPLSAGIVKRIFNMKLSGANEKQICETLNGEGVAAPYDYIRSITFPNYVIKENSRQKWQVNSVRRMLKSDVYLGVISSNKTNKVSYKLNQVITNPEEKWIKVEKCHEPIISRETFEAVQNLTSRATRTANNKKGLYLFSGMCICSGCGNNMVRRSIKDRYTYWICKSKEGGQACENHSIREEDLTAIVLEAIRAQVTMAKNAADIIENVKDAPLDQGAVRSLDEQMDKLRNAISHYESVKVRVGVDVQSGLIEYKQAGIIIKDYNAKIEKAGKAIEKLTKEKEALLRAGENQTEWLRNFLLQKDIQSLNRKTVACLIDHIVIHEDKKIEIEFRGQDEINLLCKKAEYLSMKEMNPQ